MGGGGSGGEVTRIDLTQLTAAAEERLRQISTQGAKILLACERVDRRALDVQLNGSTALKDERITVCDSSAAETALQSVKNCSVVVAFTAEAIDTQFLNSIAEAALTSKKQGIHVRGREGAVIPSKVLAYRWASMTWGELEQILSS